MAGQEELHLGETLLRNAFDLATKEVPHEAVVGVVRLCFGVIYAYPGVVLNVGSTNKLDRERPAFSMSGSRLCSMALDHRLQQCIVSKWVAGHAAPRHGRSPVRHKENFWASQIVVGLTAMQALSMLHREAC